MPGLWVSLVRIDGDQWVTESQDPLWGSPDSGMRGNDSVGAELSDLPFGYPSAAPTPDNALLLVFWCRENCLGTIRWTRLHLD